MNTKKMSEEINRNRRRFVGTAAMALAATQVGIFGSAKAVAGEAMQAGASTTKSGTERIVWPTEADRRWPV